MCEHKCNFFIEVRGRFICLEVMYVSLLVNEYKADSYGDKKKPLHGRQKSGYTVDSRSNVF